MCEIKFEDGASLTIMNLEKKVLFSFLTKDYDYYKNYNFDFGDIQKLYGEDKAYFDFIDYSLKNNPKIQKDDQGVKLKYNFGANDNDNSKKISISLSSSTLNLEEEINVLKKVYSKNFQDLEKEKEKLIKENNSLRSQLDEEKRKNDEIVRDYFENRQEYENAVSRNSEIKNLDAQY